MTKMSLRMNTTINRGEDGGEEWRGECGQTISCNFTSLHHSSLPSRELCACVRACVRACVHVLFYAVFFHSCLSFHACVCFSQVSVCAYLFLVHWYHLLFFYLIISFFFFFFFIFLFFLFVTGGAHMLGIIYILGRGLTLFLQVFPWFLVFFVLFCFVFLILEKCPWFALPGPSWNHCCWEAVKSPGRQCWAFARQCRRGVTCYKAIG